MQLIGEVYKDRKGSRYYVEKSSERVRRLGGSDTIRGALSHGASVPGGLPQGAYLWAEVHRGTHGYHRLEGCMIQDKAYTKPYRVLDATSVGITSAVFEDSGRNPFDYYRTTQPEFVFVLKEGENMDNTKYTRLSSGEKLTRVGAEESTGKLIFRTDDGQLIGLSEKEVEQILPWCFRMTYGKAEDSRVFQLPEKPDFLVEDGLYVDLEKLVLCKFGKEVAYTTRAASAVNRFALLSMGAS